MQKIDIAHLPILVAEGKITHKEAADIIWADMYVHISAYGLIFSDEDDKSEFLLYLRNRLEHVFDTYDENRAQFKTFLRGIVKRTHLSWLRKKRNTAAEEEIVRQTMITEYDREEKQLQFHEPLEDAPVSIQQEAISESKRRIIAERTALILTLKYCHAVSETVLNNVSKFTHIEAEELEKIIDRLKKQCDYKITQREAVIRRRDNAFYYHRKYLLALQGLEKGTINFEKVQKKYEMQTECWKRQNKLLSHRFVLSPTNASIANEIGMEARKVSFYITHATRNKDILQTLHKDDEQNEED